jgi:hypothetical protein
LDHVAFKSIAPQVESLQIAQAVQGIHVVQRLAHFSGGRRFQGEHFNFARSRNPSYKALVT